MVLSTISISSVATRLIRQDVLNSKTCPGSKQTASQRNGEVRLSVLAEKRYSQNVFRTDINGLRALAVVVVVLYHFGVPPFGGGFVGVDVFFVISGFLMTKIICSQMVSGEFSLLEFFIARIKRIVPALLALVMVSLAFGYLYLTPPDYRALAKHAAASAAFVSNVVYWRETGYFDVASNEKLLLHTWSLSLEAQFYLLFPIFVLGLYKWRGASYFQSGFFAAFGLSLAASILINPLTQGAAFYLLPTRGWELLAGGIVFLTASARFEKYAPVATNVGLLLIIASAVLFSADMQFPGYLALVPVLGTMLLIAFPSNHLLLTNKLAQYLGTISYSLYLWHWPIIVGAKSLGMKPSFGNNSMLFALATLLATASYWLVEKRFRRDRLERHPFAVLLKYSFPVAAVLASIWIILWTDGAIQRVPDAFRGKVIANIDASDQTYPLECPIPRVERKTGDKNCTIGPESTRTALFWGDSHVQQLYPALESISEDEDIAGKIQIVIATLGGCLPVRKAETHVACIDFNEKVLQRARQPDVRAVVIGSIWVTNLQRLGVCEDLVPCANHSGVGEPLTFVERQLSADIAELMRQGKKVYLIAPVPLYPFSVPRYLINAYWAGRNPDYRLSRIEHERKTANALKMLRRIQQSTGAYLLDPAEVLCATGNCRYEETGTAIYKDATHLSATGARLLAPMLRIVLSQFARE
jgi:peptidoglycan/LPS O-acetylase OafA/YrhL